MSSSERPYRATALALLLAAAAALAGCGEPPKPFAHQGDPQNPLLQVANPEGIALVELTGFSSAGQGRFVDTLIEQMHRAEVPAQIGEGNSQSYRLTGKVVERKADSGTELLLFWQMTDASNQVLGNQVLRQVVDTAAWRAGDPKLMAALARQSTGVVLPMLPSRDRALAQARIPKAPEEPGANNIVPPLGTRAAPARTPAARPQVAQVGPAAPVRRADQPGAAAKRDLPPVALRPVEGAPGDGAESLHKALLHFLGLANVPVVSEHDNPFAVVSGTVALSTVGPRQQNVQILWTLRQVSGCTMGTVSQQNRIPAGQLDGPWGDAAYAVAEGAVQGMTDLLTQLEAKPEGLRCSR